MGATVTTVNQSATSGSGGTYTILNTEAGPYNVTASATGYYPLTQSTTIPVGGTVTVNFVLSPRPSVIGTVTDGGNPVAGATITGDNQTATSGADGKYTLANMDPGTFTITANARGYLQSTQQATVPSTGSVTANFALTQTTPVTYYVAPGGNDSNSGLSTNTPWATMSNGDAKGIPQSWRHCRCRRFRLGAYYK